MRLYQYFKFAGRDFVKRKITFLLNLLFFTVSAYLVYTVVHMANMTQYQITTMERMVQQDLNYYYQVCVLEQTIEDETFGQRLNQLICGMNQIEGISGSGMYYSTNMQFEEWLNNYKVAEILEKNTYLGAGSSFVDVLYAEADLLYACGVELYKGSFEAFTEDSAYIPVLVGYDYKDIVSVGQILTNRKNQKQYCIVGILQENSRFFYKDGMIDGMDAYTSLDTYIIIPAIGYGMADESLAAALYMNTISFYVEEENEADEICGQIMELAKENQIGIQIKSLHTLLDESEKENNKENRMTWILMYVVVFLAIVAIMVTGIVQILTNKKEYAIMLASGFSYKTLCRLIFLENLIKTAIALLLSTALCWDEIYHNIFRTDQSVEVFLRDDIPIVIMIFGIVALIVTLVPGYIMSKVRISHVV